MKITQSMKKLVILFALINIGHNSLLAIGFDYPALIDRVRNDAATNIRDIGTMDGWVATLRTAGSWSQFSYGQLTTQNGTTTSDNHVLRLWHLAAAVSKEGHQRYNDSSYKEAIKRGLAYWHSSNTVDPNWWYNRIYFPQKLGEMLIFLRQFEGFIPVHSADGIDQPELLTLFQPTTINDITMNGTGANATDIALHYVYRGLLTADSALLVNTRKRLELILTSNIKGDLVYHDHGPQIQISSYGWVYCDGLIRLASYLAGSPAGFDINHPDFNQVIRFIRETQISSIRGSSWDFSVMGRAVSRVNALNANLNYIQQLADIIDPEHANLYNDALDRFRGNKPAHYNVRSFNKHYWVSDYTQHARNGYLFAVRNVSNRTVETETGNGENLKANYFSYGATFISVDGNEYKNIMPYWDWAMIPGTTFPHTTTFPSRTAWGFNYGTSAFVGGVSDGEFGASVLDLNKLGITAKKSWFFFEQEIVCLGSGINDASNRNVRTTVNQVKMETPSYSKVVGSSNEQMQSVSSQVFSNNQLEYIRHGKVAYFFPEQGNIKYTMRSQSGSWRDINSGLSANTESGYVFSLWFDHGNNPSNENYSYIVVPGIDSEAKAQSYTKDNIVILENSSRIQAVHHNELSITQAIFYEAGTLTIGNLKITVNRPCALQLKEGRIVTVADPAQLYSSIAVTLELSGIEYRKVLALPSSTALKGSSVTVEYELPTLLTDLNNPADISFHMQANQQLTIQSGLPGIAYFQVFSSNGKLILQDEFSGNINISLHQFQPGAYIITARNQQGISSKKFII